MSQGSWGGGPQGEDKEGFVGEVVPGSGFSAQTHPVMLGLQVDLQGLESALQLMGVALVAPHSGWTGGVLGQGRRLRDQAQSRGIGVGPHGDGTLGKFGPLLFTCSLYQASSS